eukprot:scaffold36921_cov33-Phaeocystis_antarctica.AAC.1
MAMPRRDGAVTDHSSPFYNAVSAVTSFCPRGPTDKASAYGAEDSEFESLRGSRSLNSSPRCRVAPFILTNATIRPKKGGHGSLHAAPFPALHRQACLVFYLLSWPGLGSSFARPCLVLGSSFASSLPLPMPSSLPRPPG